MNSFELRKKFLNFFNKKGHTIIPGASLIPENDPTVLFTTAGMHPLVPFLLGEKHPGGKRLTNFQKCLRTNDIDQIGDDTHLTFFEMLGNWSLNDYWKEEAINWAFEFLTKELNIPIEKLAISCFAGDEDSPRDEESAKIWESLGINKKRIAFLPKEDNWWGPAGETGPCGPDTEIFYWKLNNNPPEIFDPQDKNWVEIWNNVFMEYIKNEEGKYIRASLRNVDTGMGLERTIAVLNGKKSVYETDVFWPIIEEIEKISNSNYQENEREFRIIADHIKAGVFLVSEGIIPSNLERGYVLRRLIRRTVRYGKLLKMPDDFLEPLIRKVIEIYKEVYPELKEKENEVISIMRQEEKKFEMTLEKGINEFNKKIKELLERKTKEPNVSLRLNGKDVFDLYQTYGFPAEITKELAEEKGIEVFLEDFKKELQKHQELSRTASAGMFKGGLADASMETTKLHTAAHIMLAGLRKILGNHVVQKGSNITQERLRFDFSHPQKLTSEEIKMVEDFVNEAIKKDLPVWCEEMSLKEAKEINAIGAFESKYGERVKVYFIGEGEENISKEICGGPHVERTGILGHFKIIKEESSSAGVRRIKAILE